MLKSEIEDIVKNVIAQMAKIKSSEVLLSSKLEDYIRKSSKRILASRIDVTPMETMVFM